MATTTSPAMLEAMKRYMREDAEQLRLEMEKWPDPMERITWECEQMGIPVEKPDAEG